MFSHSACELYFPTRVFNFQVDDHLALNENLISLLREKQATSTSRVERSNVPELGGWHSGLLQPKDSIRLMMAPYLNHAIKLIGSAMRYKDPSEIAVEAIWGIINGPTSFNKFHIHPNSLWSGVYYLQVPAGSGVIEFTDPRVANVMNDGALPTNQPRPREDWTKINFQPKPGQMLVFPSWLSHGVAPNLTQVTGPSADRIIISFNLITKN